ncbi:hypothetical protein [Geoglobus acetivorans]|uniref:Uncharacterized protein n=1 Tax=Geoglobus acetivorans TaxID=565033 RepID=A0A0A7GF00_GEOAI|nr:hypothetical protein GACE_0487 [Geoglobus acetivorans]
MREMNDRGQLIITMALLISILLIGLSYVYSQNLLAGTETSISQLNFPKNDIRYLKRIAVEELTEYAGDPSSFLQRAKGLDNQITALYALHGAYASIDVYDIKKSFVGGSESITSFTVKIIFSNTEVEYEETITVQLT